MANSRKNKIIPYRRYRFFNIGTIMFGVLFVYMIICLVMYLTTEHVTPYEVTAGPLAGNYRYTALALKKETVVKADQNGTVSYYAREGSKVGMGNSVCSIDEAGKMASVAATAKEELVEGADKEMLSKIRSEMSSFAANYSATSYQAVYNFKSDVESSILELTNEKALSSLKDSQGSTLSMVDLCTAPKEGIVVYSEDGYEDLQAEDVKASDFDLKNYHKTNLRLNKEISTGDSLYKLLTDENWSLIFPLDQRMAAEFSDRTSIRFRFLKDGTTFTGDFSIFNNKDGYFGKIDMSTSLIRYASERFLEIELVLSRKTGLKIPNSAIAQKIFYKIPKEFALYEEEEPKEISIIKQVPKKDGSSSAKYITATVYKEEKTYFLVDSSHFEEGDVILMAEKSKQYTIGDKETLEGVYNINKGYAIFRAITVVDQNEEYCIVEEGATFGLSQYDHIALDASTVNDKDIEYR